MQCKFCGHNDLRWSQSGSKWIMLDKTDQPHRCIAHGAKRKPDAETLNYLARVPSTGSWAYRAKISAQRLLTAPNASSQNAGLIRASSE